MSPMQPSSKKTRNEKDYGIGNLWISSVLSNKPKPHTFVHLDYKLNSIMLLMFWNKVRMIWQKLSFNEFD